MSWRDKIAQRLIEAAKARDARTISSGVGYPSSGHYSGDYMPQVYNHAAQQEINAIQAAETAFNNAQGNRMQAAEQTQGYLNSLLATPGAHPRNITRTEDTLGVLQSEHPLDAWWNK